MVRWTASDLSNSAASFLDHDPARSSRSWYRVCRLFFFSRTLTRFASRLMTALLRLMPFRFASLRIASATLGGRLLNVTAFINSCLCSSSAGERTDRGSITHTGDKRLRSKMIQASWSAIRKDGELRDFFRSVCHRHPRPQGPRVAIVAVARKLSVRISVVLMKQRPYVVREKVHLAPLTQEETSPQGTTRRRAESGDKDS